MPKGGSAQRRSAREKTNCGNQVVEIQGDEEREKKDCCNRVAEIQGGEKKKKDGKKKNCDKPNMRGKNKKKKKKKTKQKEWYFALQYSLWWTPTLHF